MFKLSKQEPKQAIDGWWSGSGVGFIKVLFFRQEFSLIIQIIDECDRPFSWTLKTSVAVHDGGHDLRWDVRRDLGLKVSRSCICRLCSNNNNKSPRATMSLGSDLYYDMWQICSSTAPYTVMCKFTNNLHDRLHKNTHPQRLLNAKLCRSIMMPQVIQV